MEANDTVINRGKMVDGGHVESLLREQAEVSFEAGYEAGWQGSDSRDFWAGIYAGRKEVVNWMFSAMAFTNSENLPPNILRVDFKYDEWQSKLNEWGIEIENKLRCKEDNVVLKPDEGIRQGHCNNGGIYGETIY